jgi:uncharacterized protein YggE
MRTITLFLVVAAFASAQLRQRTVRAVGTATVSTQPDLVRVSLSVVTTAPTAAVASEQNATIVDRVINQVRAVVGNAGQVRTTGYSLGPNYSQSRDGTPPQIVSYTLTNTLEVTSPDLSRAGQIIDTASGAGANRINGLSFGLRDSNDAQTQALTRAATRARDQARAIALGVGLSLGPILSLEEGSVVSPVRGVLGAPDASAATRVEPGLVEVTASVTLEAELSQ